MSNLGLPKHCIHAGAIIRQEDEYRLMKLVDSQKILKYFFSFDKVKIYYDNGQIEVNKILASVFSSLLENVEFRKVIPSDYRLFQVADLVCAMQLLELKMVNHALSKSERYFFIAERTLKKNYLKPLQQKKMQ